MPSYRVEVVDNRHAAWTELVTHNGEHIVMRDGQVLGEAHGRPLTFLDTIAPTLPA